MVIMGNGSSIPWKPCILCFPNGNTNQSIPLHCTERCNKVKPYLKVCMHVSTSGASASGMMRCHGKFPNSFCEKCFNYQKSESDKDVIWFQVRSSDFTNGRYPVSCWTCSRQFSDKKGPDKFWIGHHKKKSNEWMLKRFDKHPGWLHPTSFNQNVFPL